MKQLWPSLAALVGALACGGSGDRSAGLKAHAQVKPGIPIWTALDSIEQAQFPDITFSASGKECSHPGVEVGRKSGPRFLRVLRKDIDPKYPVTGYAYTEEGFATSDEFLKALQARVDLFVACKSVVVFLGRYQGWGNADGFEMSIDKQGTVTSVTPLKELRYD